MASFTRKAILATFEDMLQKTKFDKITVSAIVAKCGISPNTFYYHFRSIYDLLDAWLRDRLNQYAFAEGENTPWQDAVRAFLRDIKANATLVYHIVDSLSCELFERYIYNATYETFYQFVRRRAEGVNISENRLKEISDFCYYTFFGYFMKSIWSRMSIDYDADMDRLSILFESFVHQAIQLAEHP